MLGQVPIYSGCAFVLLFNETKINTTVLAVQYLLWYVQHVSLTYFSVCYSNLLLVYFIACKGKVVNLDAEEKKGMQSCCNCVFE